MNSLRGSLFRAYRSLHTISRDGRPSEYLKKRIAEIDKKKKAKDERKHQLFVEVPESKEYLDTATLPMTLVVVGTALFVKLLMILDESKSQERIEERIKNAPEGQGTVRMLTREEWDFVQEVRPRTPFESKYSRDNARIRTGEPISWEDLKDWSVDMVTDGLTRAEENAKKRN